MVSFVRRRRMSAACVVGALLVTGTACGTSSGSGSAATSATAPATAASTGSAQAFGTGTSAGAAPPAEPTGLESAGPSGSKVAVSYATLPVGGGPNTIEHDPACVTVNYMGALNEGMTVSVAAVTFSPPGVFVHSGGCGGDPDCAPPFAFTSSGGPCSVNLHAVTKKSASTKLGLLGTPHCAAAKSSCANLSGNQGISLDWRPPGASPASPPSPGVPKPVAPTSSAPQSVAPKSVAPQGTRS